MAQASGSDLTFGTAIIALIVFIVKELYGLYTKDRVSLKKADEEHLKAIHENTQAIMLLNAEVKYLMDHLGEVKRLKKDVDSLALKIRTIGG